MKSKKQYEFVRFKYVGHTDEGEKHWWFVARTYQINVEVPDDYEFEDGYKLLEDANRWDYDYQIIWAKEL